MMKTEDMQTLCKEHLVDSTTFCKQITSNSTPTVNKSLQTQHLLPNISRPQRATQTTSTQQSVPAPNPWNIQVDKGVGNG